MPVMPTMSRKPGRPKVGATRDERVKHIKCTYFLLLGGYSSAALARMHGVGRSTVYNWRDLVLKQYSDPEAEGLVGAPISISPPPVIVT